MIANMFLCCALLVVCSASGEAAANERELFDRHGHQIIRTLFRKYFERRYFNPRDILAVQTLFNAGRETPLQLINPAEANLSAHFAELESRHFVLPVHTYKTAVKHVGETASITIQTNDGVGNVFERTIVKIAFENKVIFFRVAEDASTYRGVANFCYADSLQRCELYNAEFAFAKKINTFVEPDTMFNGLYFFDIDTVESFDFTRLAMAEQRVAPAAKRNYVFTIYETLVKMSFECASVDRKIKRLYWKSIIEENENCEKFRKIAGDLNISYLESQNNIYYVEDLENEWAFVIKKVGDRMAFWLLDFEGANFIWFKCDLGKRNIFDIIESYKGEETRREPLGSVFEVTDAFGARLIEFQFDSDEKYKKFNATNKFFKFTDEFKVLRSNDLGNRELAMMQKRNGSVSVLILGE